MSGCTLMTYGELAEALGIRPASAKKTAQRHRWPRALGSDGCAQIMVPNAYLKRRSDAVQTDKRYCFCPHCGERL